MVNLVRPEEFVLSKGERVLRRWEDLKALRVGWESTWQDICDYFLPRREFNVQKFPGELRDRRLLDATGMICADRLGAMLFAYLISPSMPFVRPSVDSSLVAAGRSVEEISDEDSDWLDGVQWSMHDHFMSVKSGFKTAGYEALVEYVTLGNGVFWTGSRPGFGARYQSRPLQSCWFAANADDEVDTLYYAFTLPAHRIVERWPAAAELETVKVAMATLKGQHTPIKLLLACEPRPGGRAGAASYAKPFASLLVVIAERAVIEESGYDSFPYAVPRFYLKPGEVYAYGPGHVALPDMRMLNAMMESVLRGAELRADPPLMAPLRLFSRALQRKPGAVNYYQASQLGLQTAEQAVRALHVAGDVGIGVDLIKEMRQQIEYAFFIDWMRLRENGNMTATEVNERRDLRLRALSPIVGRTESDFMGPTSERTFEINAAAGHFGEPPEGLAGLDIAWAYTGPMALAQQQGQREAVLATVELVGRMGEFDPRARMVFDAEEAVRVNGEAMGLAPAVLRTRMAVAQMADTQAQAESEVAAAQEAGQAAAALRDGAQGVASLAGAMGGGVAQAA